jgi:hypothetical protein
VTGSGTPVPDDVERFFADHPSGLAVFERVSEAVAPAGPVTVRVSRSQVAFRRTRGFAFLWLPGMYLRGPGAEVVLSIALGREVASERWKQVVSPSPGSWMHHLEVGSPEDVDDEVAGWLLEAAERS